MRNHQEISDLKKSTLEYGVLKEIGILIGKWKEG